VPLLNWNADVSIAANYKRCSMSATSRRTFRQRIKHWRDDYLSASRLGWNHALSIAYTKRNARQQLNPFRSCWGLRILGPFCARIAGTFFLRQHS
jgi:hypothetical protein